MGECKSQMKDIDKTKKSGIFGGLKKNKKKEDKKSQGETFAKYINESEEILTKLIEIKEKDLKDEKGQETKNAKSLAQLKSMAFHLDSIVDIAGEYGE